MNKEISLDERIEKLFESGWLNEFNYLENQLQEARYLVCVLQKENQQLKKQKDDVVEYCNKTIESLNWKKIDIMQILTPENGYLKADIEIEINKYKDLLRMLGEIE